MLWWSLMLGGTVWMLAKATAPRPFPILKGPVVASVAHPTSSLSSGQFTSHDQARLLVFLSCGDGCGSSPPQAN